MSPIGVARRGALGIVMKKMACSMIYEKIHLKLGPRALPSGRGENRYQLECKVFYRFDWIFKL